MEKPYVITNSDGIVLAAFSDETDRDEAMLTGEFPDDAVPAFINEAI